MLSYLNKKERKYCAFPAPVLLSIVVGRYLGWRSVSYDLRGSKAWKRFENLTTTYTAPLRSWQFYSSSWPRWWSS